MTLSATRPNSGTVKTMNPNVNTDNSGDFEVIRQRIHRAADVTGVPTDIAEMIAQPRRVIEMNLVIKMEDGSRGIFPAWRVHHSSTRAEQGMKGGFKISTHANRDSIIALAAGMTLKTTVAGLPLGGAKGGICADVHALSAVEKERLIRRYAAEIAPDLGVPSHWVDVPAPDMGTNAGDMAIFCDTISRLHGGFTPGVVTGKPIEIGGIPGRTEATGYGVAHVAHLLQTLEGRRVVISGFGNVGSYAGVFAHSYGANVVAISDPYLGGTLTNSVGIDVAALHKQLETAGREPNSFADFVERGRNGTQLHSNFTEALSHMPGVDVYFPCAAPQSVDEEIVGALYERGLSMVVEGANSPMTPEAAAFADMHAISVVPDVLANAGGVICSFLEMSKAASMSLPSKEETLGRVGKIIGDAFWAVCNQAKAFCVSDLRLAADAYAVSEVAKVHHLRGVY